MGRLYDLQAWKRARSLHLANEPMCRACAARGIAKPAQHVDHIIPIAQGGDWFDGDNLASYCGPCHSVKTLSDKGYVARMGCGQDGQPIDPNHHWNRPG